MAIIERFKNAWNAFAGRDPTDNRRQYELRFGSSSKPDRRYLQFTKDNSQVSMVYNKIAVDCSTIDIKHVRLNDDDKYKETIEDSLNYALTASANVDQTGRAMILDAVFSMLDEGSVALVPVVTEGNPERSDAYTVEEIRVGKVVEWYPRAVRVEVYDEDEGRMKQIEVQKRYTPIVENPFYMTMNRPNSTAQRLRRILSQLDKVNDAYNPNKADMIVQVPYKIKSEAKRKLAKQRLQDIEEQLADGNRGIIYMDDTEKVIQLNRSLENNLWAQAKDLTEQLYAELGFSKAVFDGTADEATMLNYYSRTIEPILSAFTEAMERTWISKTARSQKQAIRFFRNPFKLVPVGQLAEMADKLTRNEIMSSNEIRAIIGLKPDKNPKSDMLINSNLNQPEGELPGQSSIPEDTDVSTSSVAPFQLSEKVGAMKI